MRRLRLTGLAIAIGAPMMHTGGAGGIFVSISQPLTT